jgi:hypothetical protein
MRIIGRLLGLAAVGLGLTAIAGAIGAHGAKRRIVPLDAPDANDVRLASIFEPISFRSTAASFRGGTIECWYGGGVFDLRDATLDPGGAHLQVKAVFGGGQILVPETWQVSLRIVGLGGAGDTRPQAERPADAPQLTIEGTALFGGFGVATEFPEAAAKGLEEAIAKTAQRRNRRVATPEDAEAIVAV